MTLIKSISGIRGTIGGNPGDSLTPVDAVKFASAYGSWLKSTIKKTRQKLLLEEMLVSLGEMIKQSCLSYLNWFRNRCY